MFTAQLSCISLGRPSEAVAFLEPALRGPTEASNLYVSRTELHEALARAFEAAGQPDSAAVHYRKVVRAWQRGDPAFRSRALAGRHLMVLAKRGT